MPDSLKSGINILKTKDNICRIEQYRETEGDYMQEVKNIPSIAEQEKIITFMCICPECSSWVECEEKGGFCFETIGKSKCISEKSECICRGCPVYSRLGFEYAYYCTRGSSKEQEGKLTGKKT